MTTQREYFIGLMSGTSLDGVDAVLVSIAHPEQTPALTITARVHEPFTPDLRTRLLALHTPDHNELHDSALISNELADTYAAAIAAVLNAANIEASDIRAIGSHGQTIRHRPDLEYTLQLNAPARLAEATNIDVIADFRSRDIAAGGQGAPLVPVFHAHLFGTDQERVILNLGGIANVTLLRPGKKLLGFDTGPANMLMDAWCQLHTGHPFDEDGAWGASGTVQQTLLQDLLASQPWLSQPAPKSTGRDMFNLGWLQAILTEQAQTYTPEDVQATLQQLTAVTVIDALRDAGVQPDIIYGCGGGVLNQTLMGRFKQLGVTIEPTDVLGIASQDMEALAFAWLAWAHVHRIPLALSPVTGARGARVLGACWPA